jgi:hypothetical protein
MAPLWLNGIQAVKYGVCREVSWNMDFVVVVGFGIVLATSKCNQKISFLLKKADRLAPRSAFFIGKHSSFDTIV